MMRMRSVLPLGMIASIVAMAGQASSVAQTTPALASDPACQSMRLASTGGPMPRKGVAVLRWLGAANHELTYGDNVFLLDAYYDRTPPARPLGFNKDDINRATAIFVGHGHSDHIADAAFVAQHTGARVFGGPPSAEYLKSAGLAEKQNVLVRGGETERFNGVTVQTVLAHHSDRSPAYAQGASEGWKAILKATGMERSEADQKKEDAIRSRGARDVRVLTEGTIAYLFTFDTGFKLLYLDSSGPITDGERKLMQQIGRTDVALVAYQGFFVSQRQVDATLPLIKLFNPRVYVPTHHDETGGSFPDMAMYPLFTAIRDEMPDTRTISPLYRSPVCFDTTSKDVFVGR